MAKNVNDDETVSAVVEDSEDEGENLAAAAHTEVKEVVDSVPKVVKKKVVRKRKPKAEESNDA